MYKCKHCGKEFEDRYELTGHVTKEHGKKSDVRSSNIIEYNKNPKLCKNCGEKIDYNHRANIFCNHSCSASYNNKGIVRNGTKQITSKCLNCGKEYLAEKNKKRIFCSMECSTEYKKKQIIEEWIKTGTGKISSGSKTIREYIADKQENKCAICGIENEWNGKYLIFILDHIDGNSNNNLPNNLRLVCSNCDSQLDTYKFKNKGSGRFYRRKRFKEGKSY